MLKTDLNALPVGAAILDLYGNIVSVNRTLRLMLSLGSEEITSRPATDHLFPKDRPWAFDLFAQLACGETDSVNCCIRIRGGQNQMIWAIVSGGLLKQPETPHRSLLLIIQDISHEKEMLDEIENGTPYRANHHPDVHFETAD